MKLSGQFSGGSYESVGLQEYVNYYSTKMSYEEVSKLVIRTTGDSLLSDQRIHQIVCGKASQISNSQVEQISEDAFSFPAIDSEIDLYSADSDEVLLLEDGILVPKQKEHRDKQPKATRERIQTDVVALQQADGGSFHYLAAGSEVSLEALLKSEFARNYGTYGKAVPLVVLSDGASGIRKRMKNIFGENVVRILDCYHLNKKVWSLMSMIAPNKKVKSEKAFEICALLWKGKTDNAIEIIHSINAKNKDKQNELTGYLDKHRSEIIDYERRKSAGKKIGSGRIEKAVDLAVGHRQKRNAMSWSIEGSRAITLLTVAQLNNKWEEIWN